MKKLELKAKLRKKEKSFSASQLRRLGDIPAVIYGNLDSKSISINSREFMFFMRKSQGSSVLVELILDDGERKLTIIKSIQRNPIKNDYYHIDFYELSLEKEMITSIPIRIIGESIGVKNENGLLDVHLHLIEVKCLPNKLPEYIEINVQNLQVGGAIHINDLEKINGVVFTGNSSIAIVSCAEPRVREEKEAEVVSS